jgi:site-specific DNA recombinase
MNLRCAAYARYSTDRQNPLSTEDQLAKCRQFAADRGWQFLEDFVFTDEEISGATLDRPGLLLLLAAAESKPPLFDGLLIEDASRLSRKQADVLNLCERLSFAGVKIFFISQGIDSGDETFQLLLLARGMIDQLFLADTAKRVRRGLEGLIRRGLHTGGRCFGYRSRKSADGVRLEIAPDQAATVRRIFESYAAGDSLKTIAKRLNAERVHSPAPYRGQVHPSWAPPAISVMLRNERYRGVVIWDRTRKLIDPKTGRRVQRLRPQSEWKISEAPHLQIVSDELWNEVQERRQSVAESFGVGHRMGLCSRSYSAKYLFSGFLKCGLCGSNLTLISGRGQSDWGKYGCPLHHSRGVCRNTLLLRRVKLEREILTGLSREVLSEDVVSYTLQEFERQLRAKIRAAKDDAGLLRQRREKLKREIGNLSEAIAEVGHSAELLTKLAERERELAKISDEILSTDEHDIEARLDEIDRFVRERMQDVRKRLLADVERAKAELAKHCSAITITPEAHSYRLSGDWDLLGGRTVGAEGQNRTAYAGLFRAALYR